MTSAGALSTTSDVEDNALFASVVTPHIDAAYRLARWLTGSSTDAEDVVQDAALRTFRAIRGFAGGSSRAWVLSIVRSTAYTWLRKHRSGMIITVEDLEAAEAAHPDLGQLDAATPEAALIAKGDHARLRAAIAALSMPFREILVLRDIEGLSYREIAEVSELPIGTVMTRLARARGRLSATIVSENAGVRINPGEASHHFEHSNA